jgi:hypothetical protein
MPTLLGHCLRVSGEIFTKPHPALIGQMNHFKLVGVYDKKIQKLANPRTARHHVLRWPLAESEAAHRADALTNSESSFINEEEWQTSVP